MDLRLTTDRSRMIEWVKYLKSAGGTALFDALNQAQIEMQSAKFRSRAIVLISDGGENASNWTEQQALNSFHADGAPVLYALVNEVHSGQPSSTPHQEAADRKRLLSLVSESGGLIFPIETKKDREPAISRLLRAMQGRYRLEFTPPNTKGVAARHRLDVQLRKDLRRQKMNVVAARGYDALRQ